MKTNTRTNIKCTCPYIKNKKIDKNVPGLSDSSPECLNFRDRLALH